VTLDFNFARDALPLNIPTDPREWCLHRVWIVTVSGTSRKTWRFRRMCPACFAFERPGYTGVGWERAVREFGEAAVKAAVYPDELALYSIRARLQGLRHHFSVKAGIDGYRQYIASAEWFYTRHLVLNEHDFKCSGCGADAEEVHHLNYASLGQEGMGDLVPLCRKCHRTAHGRAA